MLSTNTALLYTVVLGAVIFLCRFLPFTMFRDNSREDGKEEKTRTEKTSGKIKAFLKFVEATVPAVAMTVLAINALASETKLVLALQPGDIIAAGPQGLAGLIPLAAAALLTAALHIWKRNALVSIFGGTALYMVLLGII